MADDRSRHGYDDVLSSVRRIVAAEVEAVVAGPEGRHADDNKLLLTPALRVAPPADSVADEAEPASADDEAASDRDFPTLEERIAELEAAVGGAPSDWEPDGSEDQAQHAPDAIVLPLHPASRRSFGEPIMGETNEADLVFAVPGDPDEPGGPADRGERSSALDPEGDAVEAAQPANDPTPAAADLHAAPGAVPLPSFRHRGQFADAPAPVSSPVSSGATSASQSAYDDEPTLLDEGALRELVAEIVREELQGGLGERITRNVRKLVRAEIQRAFAARDLD